MPSIWSLGSEYRGLRVNYTAQGKVAELRQELLQGGGKKDRANLSKKIALKKIVANMTMSNNDMVALFPDVISCMTIQSLEIKKMYGNLWEQSWSSILIVQKVFLILGQLRTTEARYCAQSSTDPGARHGRWKSADKSTRPEDNVIHTRTRVRRGNDTASPVITSRSGSVRQEDCLLCRLKTI